MKRFLLVLWATAITLAPGVAFAAQAQKLDTGNTAWILTSTALVLFMTLPGLSLFYGGLVRAKNVLSVLMQCFTIACAVSIVWLVVGYSLVFEAGNAFIGGLGKAFFAGVGVDSLSGNIPETVFAMFQLTFAIITPALIVGSFAERMRFSALLIFSSSGSWSSTPPWPTGCGAGDGSARWRARFRGRHRGAHQLRHRCSGGRHADRPETRLSQHGHTAP